MQSNKDDSLRRRFEFIDQMPDEKKISDKDLKEIFKNLNEHLSDEKKSSDMLIGHSYFMDKKIDDLEKLMNNKVRIRHNTF